MDIKVLGSGCACNRKALEVVEKVVAANGVDAHVEYITDLQQLMEYDVMSLPAVVVDGKVVLKGGVPSEAEVKKALGIA